MNYYISDLHLGHKNILRICNHPFNNIEEMEIKIIENWNKKVTPEDDIWLLGDVIHHHGGNYVNTLKNLNGKKHLIIGNNEKNIMNNEKAKKLFESIDYYREITDNDKMVVMFHHPILEWNRYYQNSIHLHGHIHNKTTLDTYKIIKNRKNAYNVGVDVIGFEPCTLDEVIDRNIEFWKINE